MPTLSSFGDAAGRLRALLTEYGSRLPPGDADNYLIALDAGELTMATEDFCTQLYEYDVVLPSVAFALLAELGAYCRLDPRSWGGIRHEPSGPVQKDDQILALLPGAAAQGWAVADHWADDRRAVGLINRNGTRLVHVAAPHRSPGRFHVVVEFYEPEGADDHVVDDCDEATLQQLLATES